MPILIAVLVVAVLSGLFVPQRLAVGLTGLAGAVGVVVFVWAVADGKGDDPWWFIPIAVAAAAFSLGVCALLAARRTRGAEQGRLLG